MTGRVQAAIFLAWDSAQRNLRLTDAGNLNGVTIEEIGGLVMVSLSNGTFDPHSTLAGVQYNHGTPGTSSFAAITITDGFSVTLAATDIVIDQTINLTSGSMVVDAGPSGAFTLGPGGRLSSLNGSISITADWMTLDGSIEASNGTAQLAPASSGWAVDLGEKLSPTLLSLDSEEIGRIKAASLTIGNAQCGPIYLTGSIAPQAPKLAFMTPDDVVELGGDIQVAQLELQANSIFLNTTNQVGRTALQSGYLILQSAHGPALSGQLVVGQEDGGAYALARWFGDAQIGSDAPLVVQGAGQVDVNGHEQIIGGLSLNGGALNTQDGTLLLNGDIQRNRSAQSTVALAGNLDFMGETRAIYVGGTADYINLNGDLYVAANMAHGGFNKLGPGTMVLGGRSTLEKTCAVELGTLLVDGVLDATVVVNPAGNTNVNGVYLTGSGIVGNFIAKRDAVIVPGDIAVRWIGAMGLKGGTTSFEEGSALVVFIRGMESSWLVNTNGGDIDLTGNPDLVLFPYSPIVGQVYTLVSSFGGHVLGEFKDLPNGTVFADAYGWGHYFQINYSEDAVTLKSGYPTATLLSVVPETAVYGDPVTFTASVSYPPVGTPSGSVTFHDNGEVIGSAPLIGNQATFTIATLSAGNHEIAAVYGGDSIFLASSSITNLGTAGLPAIVTQPADYAAVVGGGAAFAVTVDGYSPMHFQWRKNGAALPGATNATLQLGPLVAGQAGNYDVIATNFYGSVTSQVARLTVSSFYNFGETRYGLGSLPVGTVAPVSVALGQFHNVVLQANGTARVWGNNYYGQLALPAGLSNLVAVSAGAYHSLVLNSNGIVTAWGWNLLGQTNVPQDLTNAMAIASGGFHNLALKTDGTVTAWGYGYNGQCAVPEGLTNVAAIAAGLYHSLALKADGTVVAWGDNTYGQGQVPAGLTNVVAVAAGGYFNIAVLADGTVYGWGENRYGQLDAPSDIGQVVAVACGNAHVLALRADGTVTAWGHNHYDQASVLPGLHDVVAIAAGGERSMVLGAR